MTLINVNGKLNTQDLTPFGPAPADAIALKFNDEVSGAEWITDLDRLAALRSEDAPIDYVLYPVARQLLSGPLPSDLEQAEAIREYLNDGGSVIDLIEAYAG